MNSQLCYINSSERISGSPSDFQIVIKDLDTAAERQGLTIQNLIIPISQYNVNSNNNSISIAVGITSGSSILDNYTNFTFDEGNISSSDFSSAFNTLTTSLGATGITPTIGITSGIITYNCSELFSIEVSKKQKFLGLSEGIHTSSLNGSVHQIVGDKFADFSGTNFIDVMLSGIQLYSSNTGNQNQELFCRVFVNGQFGEYVNWDLSNFISVKIYNRVDFNSAVNFRLLDDQGDSYDTHGLDWQISIALLDEVS